MKWDYKIITTDHMIAEKLNQEGVEGWEHYYTQDDIYFYFKRAYAISEAIDAKRGWMPAFEIPPMPAVKSQQNKSGKRK